MRHTPNPAAELPSTNALVVAALSHDPNLVAFAHGDHTVTYGQTASAVSQLVAALRARDIGARPRVTPDATIIHYEGLSSGVVPNQGVKRGQ